MTLFLWCDVNEMTNVPLIDFLWAKQVGVTGVNE